MVASRIVCVQKTILLNKAVYEEVRRRIKSRAPKGKPWYIIGSPLPEVRRYDAGRGVRNGVAAYAANGVLVMECR